METLSQRLEEQKGRHQGGNKWIGTGGTSPVRRLRLQPRGHPHRPGQVAQPQRGQGLGPARVPQPRRFGRARHAQHQGRAAAGCASSRAQGAPDEFDLENTIASTARKAYLDIHMRPERRNAIKVLMLMDIGGTMDDHIKLAEELFSAAKTEFKHLEFFYFHNCLYDFVWKDNRRRHSERTRTWDLLHKYGHDYKVIFVGDATMSPYEILQPGGSVEYFNEEPGAVWIKRFTDVYPKCVWLNPEPEEIWNYRQSIGVDQGADERPHVPDHAGRPGAGDEAAGEIDGAAQVPQRQLSHGRGGRRGGRRRRHGGARAQVPAAPAPARQALLRAAGRGHRAVADPARRARHRAAHLHGHRRAPPGASTTTPSTSTSAARAACWSSPTRRCTACSSRSGRATRWCAPASASRRRPRRISTSSAAPRTGSSTPSRASRPRRWSRAPTAAIASSSVMKMPLLNINELMRKHWNGPPNLLSLDTEGFDLPILRSLDFKRLRPDVICVETVGDRRAPRAAGDHAAHGAEGLRRARRLVRQHDFRRPAARRLTQPKWPGPLRRTFRLRRLRPGQRPVIENVLAGRDTLAIMPSGAGKSLWPPAAGGRDTRHHDRGFAAHCAHEGPVGQAGAARRRGRCGEQRALGGRAAQGRAADSRQQGRLHLHHARAARRPGVPGKTEGQPDRPLRGRRGPLQLRSGARISVPPTPASARRCAPSAIPRSSP